MKKIFYILMMGLLTFTVAAQKESGDVRSGNRYYKDSKFTEAEIAYRKGLLKNKASFEANYNLGNALFRQKKYTEAVDQYNNALTLQPKEKTKIAAALHNTGNSLLVDNKIEESIKAYQSALKANPKDNDTRYNLAYAQAMLKKQQQNKDKNKDKKDQNKDKDKQDQKQPQQPKDQQQKPQPQQQQQPKMSKENAQQILDALSQDEKNAQDKAKKQPVRGTKKAEKDW
ncbi:MAG: tetratricopeptide repeat protein [Paludibacter sp.]